jgi:hypothetical protein
LHRHRRPVNRSSMILAASDTFRLDANAVDYALIAL